VRLPAWGPLILFVFFAGRCGVSHGFSWIPTAFRAFLRAQNTHFPPSSFSVVSFSSFAAARRRLAIASSMHC
jgi:hypothetical protein